MRLIAVMRRADAPGVGVEPGRGSVGAIGERRPSRPAGRRVLVAMLAVSALLGSACGGDDDTAADETSESISESSDSGTADTADSSTADSSSADTADDSGTASDTAETDEVGIDPSIEVPEWVEVVGVAEALNVRAGPGSDFDRVARAAPGDTLRVLGGARNADGELWLQVEVGGDTTGWVFDQYTSGIARPTPTALPTPTPIGTPTPLPIDDGDGGDAGDAGDAGDDGGADGTALVVVAPEGLNLRSTPGLGGQVLRELDDGDRVQGTGATRRADGRRWTEVTFDGVTGWVASEFVAPA